MTSRSSRAILTALTLLLSFAGIAVAEADDGTEKSNSIWGWATGPSVYDEEGKRDWNIEVMPYLWLSNLNGELTLPAGGSIGVDTTFSNLASNLDAGFAGVLDVRYRRWHLLSDNSWVRLKVDAAPDAGPVTDATIESAVAFGTVGIGYELPVFENVALDLYLAARWWHVTNDAVLTTAGPGSPYPSLSETWADAIGGVRIRYQITDQWRVAAMADIGGGQASLDWSAMGSVGYFFNDYIGMTAAYRVLGVDYSSDSLGYDMKQNGLLLGLNLRY